MTNLDGKLADKLADKLAGELVGNWMADWMANCWQIGGRFWVHGWGGEQDAFGSLLSTGVPSGFESPVARGVCFGRRLGIF